MDSTSNHQNIKQMEKPVGRGRRQESRPTIDRLPPNSPEAEEGVLGCVLLDPKACLPLCVEKMRGDGAEVFYSLPHQTLYNCLQTMFECGDVIDLITLHNMLKLQGTLEEVGGLNYLSALPDKVPSTANLGYYIDILVEKWKLRRAIKIATNIVAGAYEGVADVDAFLDKAESDILSIRQFAAGAERKSIKESVRTCMDTLEVWHERKGGLIGLSTGFTDLDKMTGGLVNGEMTVIAARPSMGKTSLAMNIAEHVSMTLGLPVGVFSLEMSTDSLVMRLLCSRARVSMSTARDGFLADRDFPKLTGVAGKLSHAPIYIEDLAGLTVMELKARARRMAQQYGIKLFVVDYLQLLHATINGQRLEKREREVSECSSGCKAVAKELGVPVIVLSQLNRELEKFDKRRKPRLSDLRESGSIEQDADAVGLLYEPETEEDEDNPIVIPINLIIAKQRNGPVGEINFTFFKNITRFESMARKIDVPVQEEFDTSTHTGYR